MRTLLTLAALLLAGCAAPIMSGSAHEVVVGSDVHSSAKVARTATDWCAKYGKKAEYAGSDHIATRFLCR
jgi:uncharacterized protein YceK